MALIMNSNGEKVQASSMLNSIELTASERLSNAIEAQTGYVVDITTLTAVLKTVSEQKFYTIPFAKYVPVKVNEGTAWADRVLAFRSFISGGDFEKGYINQGNQVRLATTDAAIDAKSVEVRTWAKELSWSIPEIAEASRTGVWDVVAAKEKSRVTNWQLGIQKTIFLGSKDGVLEGALNMSEVTVNTTLVTSSLSTMTTAQLNTFAASVLGAYQENNNYTAYPDFLWVPQSDYNGLATYTSEFTLLSRKQILEQAFKEVTGKDFKILPLAYGQASLSDGKLTADRYVLGRYDEEAIRFDIPVDYTATVANSFDGFTFHNVGYGQHSGILSLRPQEFLYMDVTA